MDFKVQDYLLKYIFGIKFGFTPDQIDNMDSVTVEAFAMISRIMADKMKGKPDISDLDRMIQKEF